MGVEKLQTNIFFLKTKNQKRREKISRANLIRHNQRNVAIVGELLFVDYLKNQKTRVFNVILFNTELLTPHSYFLESVFLEQSLTSSQHYFVGINFFLLSWPIWTL